MEDFHVRYDVCSTKKRKNHAYEWLRRGEKRKENEKKTIRIRRKHFQTGNHVATNIRHPTC